MVQHRIPRGAHGQITVRRQPAGTWLARTQVRDIDGRIRSVRYSAGTKSAAARGLEATLRGRTDPSVAGITGSTTMEALASKWLQHRRDHGQVRQKGPLAPQTLATYHSEIDNVIVPAIGQVQIREANVPFLDRLFADVEHGRSHGSYPGRTGGRSTRQLRVVLGGMLGLAVAHGALSANPMRDAATSARTFRREVQFLTVEQAVLLRREVRRDSIRIEGRRMPNTDLEQLIDLLLGTGCREGEALAIRPRDLEDLDGVTPTLHVCGTLVEPRRGYVEKLHRQDTTKTRQDRRLILPTAVVEMLQERMERRPPPSADAPIFATGKGNWIAPSNMRTRLRSAIARATERGPREARELRGVTLHTLRRTVGTLLTHEISLDAARDQLGHRDPSVTYQHYVGRRATAPDVRSTLDKLLVPLPDHIEA